MSIIRELKHFASPLSLLIVEDEKELNSELLSMLSMFFSSVDFAYNGKEGLELFKKNKHDVILTDITMPKMDGIKMSSEIKNIYRDQHIVVLSAHSDTKFMIELIDIGIDQFILKPFDKNTLIYKLLKVVENITYKREFDKFYKQKEKERKNLVMEIESEIESKVQALKPTPSIVEQNITIEKTSIEDNGKIKMDDYNLSHTIETADSFMEDIKNDSLIWNTFKNDIPELMQLSEEFSDDIDRIDLEGRLIPEVRDNIVQIIHSYVVIFSTLDAMLKMTEVLDQLANFLDDLEIETLTDQQHKKLKVLEFINNDITRFLQTVFVYKDNVDIYYLEDSLESSITQMRNDVLGIEVEEEELEFF
ncbi:MAG: response regulator [Campylobacterota bacterium]|nr:response regulator [Campylobacterota bacterium]